MRGQGNDKFPRLDLLLMVLGLVCLLILMLAPLGYRWGWWHFRTSFQIIRYDAYAAVAGILVTLLIIPYRILKKARLYISLIVALVLFSVTFGIPRYWLAIARSVPPIHDITTDTEDPPQFVEILKHRSPEDNPVEYGGPELAQKQKEAYPDIKPLIVPFSEDRVFQEALETARQLGWEIVAAVPEEGRIEATDTTFWFGFKDDIVIRIKKKSSGGTRVDIRSVSRVGRSDLGANARRIRRFIEVLKNRLNIV